MGAGVGLASLLQRLTVHVAPAPGALAPAAGAETFTAVAKFPPTDPQARRGGQRASARAVVLRSCSHASAIARPRHARRARWRSGCAPSAASAASTARWRRAPPPPPPPAPRPRTRPAQHRRCHRQPCGSRATRPPPAPPACCSRTCARPAPRPRGRRATRWRARRLRSRSQSSATLRRCTRPSGRTRGCGSGPQRAGCPRWTVPPWRHSTRLSWRTRGRDGARASQMTQRRCPRASRTHLTPTRLPSRPQPPRCCAGACCAAAGGAGAAARIMR
jgi:hypothetical protein